MSGSVYVHVIRPAYKACSERQQTIETPNALVVLDYAADGALLGVEVMDAEQVDWNGHMMFRTLEKGEDDRV